MRKYDTRHATPNRPHCVILTHKHLKVHQEWWRLPVKTVCRQSYRRALFISLSHLQQPATASADVSGEWQSMTHRVCTRASALDRIQVPFRLCVMVYNVFGPWIPKNAMAIWSMPQWQTTYPQSNRLLQHDTASCHMFQQDEHDAVLSSLQWLARSPNPNPITSFAVVRQRLPSGFLLLPDNHFRLVTTSTHNTCSISWHKSHVTNVTND